MLCVMTLTSEISPVWNSGTRVAGFAMSRHARRQADERAIGTDELATVMLNPMYRQPNGSRANANLTIYLDERKHLITAVLRTDEITELATTTRRKPVPAPSPEPVFERRAARKPRPLPVQRTHILDSIHPALREEITRLVDGDFSRLVVHSPTNVHINP